MHGRLFWAPRFIFNSEHYIILLIIINVHKKKEELIVSGTSKKFISYFRNPMIGLSAVTSHGIPNSLVHLPVIIMLPFIGISICSPDMKYLIPLYLIVALYIGRDMVLMSYKNIFVPVAIWTLFILFIVFKTDITGYFALLSQESSKGITAAVSAGFVIYVALFSRWFVR